MLYKLNNKAFKLPKKCIVYLYDCYIRSRIEYCPIMFLLANDRVKQKLEAEHRRFLRGIFNLDSRTKNVDVYKISNTISFEERAQHLASKWFLKKVEDEDFQKHIDKCKCYGKFDKYNTTLDILSKIVSQD